MKKQSNQHPATSKPTSFPDHKLRQAVAFHQAGNLDEAEILYEQLLAAYPDNIDVLMLLGIAKTSQKETGNAIRLFEKVIAMQPDHALAHHNLGNALYAQKQYDKALQHLDKTASLAPNSSEAFNSLSIVLSSLERYDEALKKCEKAIALTPNSAEPYNTRATIFLNMKRYEEALTDCDKAITLNPNHASAYNNRGLALNSLKRYEEALASYDKAIQLYPTFAMAFNNRALTLQLLRQYDAALESCEKAISINIKLTMAYNNRGLILCNLQRYDEALKSYDKAIAINPDYADAYWNKSLLLLLLGQYEEGWKLYEWRWKKTGKDVWPVSGKPLWLGKEPLAGKTIFLHAEQGYGDTIQFCRYMPMVEALGAKVIIGAPNALTTLLHSLKGNYTILEQGSHSYAHDFQCPIPSLPLAFGTTLDSIPSHIPYLFAEPQKQALWQEKLGIKSRPRIGLIWSGTEHPVLRYDRSVRLDLLKPLLELDFEFHALQKALRPEDEVFFKTSKIIPHADELKDFSDTAALIMEMDLVISVDTSVAHLAGALGKRSWFLIHSEPDFRWLLNRGDNPWYPTARLFRQQKAGDWESVIEELREALLQHVF